MSGRTGLYWAWRILDRYRARQDIHAHQIEQALAAIANVTGRSPNPGPNYEFADEDVLRRKVSPR
jgi:hypothetical protein